MEIHWKNPIAERIDGIIKNEYLKHYSTTALSWVFQIYSVFEVCHHHYIVVRNL